jgi:hypothetical protein
MVCCLSVCLSVCLSLYVCACMCVCMFVYKAICVSGLELFFSEIAV